MDIRNKISSLKIVRPFSLTNEQKKRLEDFLVRNQVTLASLYDEDFPKLQALADLLSGQGQHTKEGILPPDIVEEIRKIFIGESEYVVVIQNCPELPVPNDFKHRPSPSDKSPEQFYCRSIGNALKLIANAEPYSNFSYATRVSHCNTNDKKSPIIGDFLHRDMVTRWHHESFGTHDRDKDGKYVECIMFSAPQNDEHAFTQLLHLRRALASLPDDVLMTTEVNVTYLSSIEDHLEGRKKQTKRITLQALLEQITPKSHLPYVSEQIPQGIFFDQHTDSRVLAAVNENSLWIDFQPGIIAVLSEHQMFHQAYSGHPEAIAKISPHQATSRTFTHHSAAGKAL